MQNGSLVVATYNVELVKRPGAVLDLLQREPRLGAADMLALQETDEELVAPRGGNAGRAVRLLPVDAAPAHGAQLRSGDTQPLADPGRRKPGTPRSRVDPWYPPYRRARDAHGARPPVRFYNVHFSTLWEMTPTSTGCPGAAVAADAAAARIRSSSQAT